MLNLKPVSGPSILKVGGRSKRKESVERRQPPKISFTLGENEVSVYEVENFELMSKYPERPPGKKIEDLLKYLDHRIENSEFNVQQAMLHAFKLHTEVFPGLDEQKIGRAHV